jgi:hypothetical protein
MKSNLLRIFFEWALITSLLMSIGFFAWYYSDSKAVRISSSKIEMDENHFQSLGTVMRTLESECEVYAKTNADMARLLDSLRHPPAAPAAPATNKPAGK